MRRANVYCLNPAQDLLIRTDGAFEPGGLYRCASRLVPGGKGVNVARILNRLGVPVTLTVPAGGPGAEALRELAEREEIPLNLIRTKAPVRVCVKILDGEGTQTEINGTGGPVTEEETRILIETFAEQISGGTPQDFLLCGSIPQGVEKSVYSQMTTLVKSTGNRAVLDASGAELTEGFSAGPDLIKPNIRELYTLFRSRCPGEPEPFESFAQGDGPVEFAQALYGETGTEILCTCGEKGAFFCGDCGKLSCSAPVVKEAAFAGAGDAFLAAFCAARPERTGDPEAVRRAMVFAASAAAVCVEDPEAPFREDAAEVLKKYAGAVVCR